MPGHVAPRRLAAIGFAIAVCLALTVTLGGTQRAAASSGTDLTATPREPQTPTPSSTRQSVRLSAAAMLLLREPAEGTGPSGVGRAARWRWLDASRADPRRGPGRVAPTRRHRPPRKVVHLTFDDGPSPYTRRILRILSAHDATATFFVLGDNVRHRRGALAAIRRQGSNVGNHTRTHPRLDWLSSAQVSRQLRIGIPTRCFRPPYGGTNRRVVRIARQQGLRQVLWSADSRDWERPGATTIQRNSLLSLRRRAIILMHDGGGDRTQTVRALPGLLQTLKRRGFTVRALPYC